MVKTPSMFIAADQTKAMQEQMSGAGMMTPPDPMKAFKAEWEALWRSVTTSGF